MGYSRLNWLSSQPSGLSGQMGTKIFTFIPLPGAIWKSVAESLQMAGLIWTIWGRGQAEYECLCAPQKSLACPVFTGNIFTVPHWLGWVKRHVRCNIGQNPGKYQIKSPNQSKTLHSWINKGINFYETTYSDPIKFPNGSQQFRSVKTQTKTTINIPGHSEGW